MDNRISLLLENISKVIVGKEAAAKQLTAALLCGGHVLIEDVPGVGKTQLAAALAKSVGGIFRRIQLTPDIMPSDIVGFSIVDRETGEFTYKPGAAMCNFLLADEINRASPKAQSSLLEVMEEFQVSLDGVTHPLPKPFMTLATQNPVETYGTYHLPEAQMDRFIMKISMGYPDRRSEMEILDRNEFFNPLSQISSVITTDDVLELQQAVKNVKTTPQIKQYVLNITDATRKHAAIKLGVSPRGSIAVYKAAKAAAYMAGRNYVIPDDVKEMAVCVLSHRIMMTQKGKTEFKTPEAVIEAIISSAEVPVSNEA